MATYKQVSYGSQGSDVTELQKLLNNNGYGLDVDGIFGSKTQAAVKDYQQKNQLAVDGIVGNNTWGTLSNAAGGSSGGAAQPPAQTETPTFNYGDYQPSDTVTQAAALLQQQLAQKPGAYQSQWQGQLTDMIGQILNREQFSYDLNSDALYQQYANQYAQQGRMAMMDTMGQAQAMTGGYGNSYAQGVGQQVYQGYMQQLNDKVPELYQLALSQYQMEGDTMKDQAALLAQMEDQDYGRYQDQMDSWQSERDYLASRHDAERDYDYGQWADGRDFDYGKYMDDLAYQYQQERDKVSDQQWQSEFDEAKRQYDQQYALKAGGGSGGSSGNGNTGNTGNTAPAKTGKPTYPQNGSLSQGKVKLLQKTLGVAEDGLYGPKTKAAAGGLSADEAYNKYVLGKNPNGTLPPSGFTGSTYNDAVSYIKSNGGSASGLMTSTEWTRHRNGYLKTGQSNAEGANYSSYAAYLKDFVEYATQ